MAQPMEDRRPLPVPPPVRRLALGMSRRLILGIETSNPSAWRAGLPATPGVALAANASGSIQVVGVEPIEPGPTHSDDLVESIRRLFARVGASPRDLECLCVSAGPGGYTAVRLGITAAKIIAEATGARVVAVPTALVAARNATGPFPRGVVLASKGQTAHVSVIDENGLVLNAAERRSDALDSLGLQSLIADRFLPESFGLEATRLGIPLEPLVLDPVAAIQAGVGLTPSDPADLAPIYPREPEAVRKWRELHPPQAP